MKPLPLRRIGVSLFVVALAATLGAAVRPQTKASANPAPKATTTASIEGKTLGSKSAPVTMEVFEDFQCPACGNFYELSLKQVIDNYVNTGKVYLVHRDFPLDMHPYALQAARLANAAAQLGQFEMVERALFDKQNDWAPNGKIEDAIAPSVGAAELKKIQNYEAAHMNEINASIDHDRAMGVQRNVNQTPTVFVTAHGKTEALPGGGVDYKLLKQYLDYLLRQ